jgi:hypothetical protein
MCCLGSQPEVRSFERPSLARAAKVRAQRGPANGDLRNLALYAGVVAPPVEEVRVQTGDVRTELRALRRLSLSLRAWALQQWRRRHDEARRRAELVSAASAAKLLDGLDVSGQPAGAGD